MLNPQVMLASVFKDQRSHLFEAILLTKQLVSNKMLIVMVLCIYSEDVVMQGCSGS